MISLHCSGYCGARVFVKDGGHFTCYQAFCWRWKLVAILIRGLRCFPVEHVGPRGWGGCSHPITWSRFVVCPTCQLFPSPTSPPVSHPPQLWQVFLLLGERPQGLGVASQVALCAEPDQPHLGPLLSFSTSPLRQYSGRLLRACQSFCCCSLCWGPDLKRH